ncbi:hypothetical protein Dsin_000594, partial [Dipteronia sinensis]
FDELDVRKKVQISDQMLVVDRFSSLPETIIHYILSLMETKVPAGLELVRAVAESHRLEELDTDAI